MSHGTSKRALIFVLAMAMVAMLAACANATTQPSSTPAPTESAPAASAAATDPASTEQQPVTMTCFVNFTWYWTDKFEGIIPETITAKTGVTLDVTRAVDDNQLGLMIASGDLPHLVWTQTQLDRLADSKLAHSYTDLMAQYTPDWKLDKLRETNAASFSTDGKIYFVLNAFSTEDEWKQYPGMPGVSSLAYRADMLEALGNPKLDTLDDLVTVLGLVKEKYPDKIPLATSTVFRMMAIRCMFGMGNFDYLENSDGSIIYYINHSKYKEFCAYVNNLYRNGYINADNFSLNEADTKTLVSNAQCFAFCGYSGGEMYRWGQTALKVEPEAKLMESKPLSADTVYYEPGTGWSGLIITKNNPAPDKAIKMVQYLFTEEGQRLGEWGREGIEWTMGSDGWPVFSDEWVQANTDEKILFTKYNPAFYFGTSAAVETTGRQAFLPSDYRAVYDEFKPLIKVCPWISYAKPKGDSEEATIAAKLEDLCNNSEVKVFLSASDADFEKNFDEFMANAKQIGVAKLEQYMTENVEKARALYR